jgi:hypothetical protein
MSRNRMNDTPNRKIAMGTDTEAVSERGSQYPADDLETAVANLDRVRDAVGFGPAERRIIAEALGYQTISGHAARRLGSLSHYGLIERAGKGAAKISDLGRAILIPTTEAERRAKIVAAAKQPSLYANLVAKYAGHALPSLLANLLVREHGIHENAADAATKTFRQTMEFAGLLRNGVLFEDLADSPDEPSMATHATEVPTAAPPQAVRMGHPIEPRPQAPTVAPNSFTIPLDAEGRIARIELPLPVTDVDLDRVQAWATYMRSVAIKKNEVAGISVT